MSGNTSYTLRTSDDLLICNECGAQYDVTADSGKDECKICDDPRQYVPAEGQVFTTLGKLEEQGHRNEWWQDKQNPKIWSVKTYPPFAIGERAELIQTPAGNILWDLITYLDQGTIDKIVSLGGLACICPVYVGEPDKIWLERADSPGAGIRFLAETYTDVLPGSGATAILAGGHFPGSLLLHWKKTLFIADTIFTSPSATNPVPGKDGVFSFTFFWSIPNRVPLHPDDIVKIWRAVKPLEFNTCIGAFKGQDVYTQPNEASRGTGGVKGRLLESCKIYVRAMGWTSHVLLEETL
ncbi:uncharacterized protein MYCFIDRAFT_188812 [Pseudocercospora fijiensis CIRAD86]|uniref:Metallo-beta-lactamase domain-containing protein n=1 Tax=Pseudocercospora fijiensis (strain CIRAD86) TaxID=383855 RepID=M3AXT1_PSEFD|nr:uncharacterized protein MYCFIDRAFT_188812 [Pseudocercospora fijiensis CIRAD86]EME81928.1 hypothetical protein MYCFIDRAFT_188812 [Pseudocercospora fijiensis CIRAD86]